MSRTKVTNKRLTFHWIGRRDLNAGKWTYEPQSVTPNPGFTETVVFGDNISNWKWLIANAENATTSLSGNRIRCWATPGYTLRIYKPKSLNPATLADRYKYGAEGQLIVFQHPAPADTGLFTQANDQAIISFLKECYEQQRAFQALVTFGELGEALRMIKSPGKALRRGLGDYLEFLRGRRGKVPKNRKRTFLSDTWLEYMFGWRPLISDISAGFEAVARYHHQLKPSKMVKAVGVAYGPTNYGSESLDSRPSGIQIGWKVRSWDEYHVKYYGRVAVLNPHGYLPNMRNWGADMRSFVPSLWELIPYSFLVDYFTNIGDVLSAFAFNQVDLRWKVRGTKAVRYSESTEARIVPSTETSLVAIVDTGNLGKLRYARESVTRGTHLGNLVPTLSFEIPGMSSLKWLNMAALARSQKRIIPF